MRRRELIKLFGSAAAAWPLVASAQQSERMRRVGILMSQADNADAGLRLGAFRQELERLGWFEGRNVQIEYRYAAGSSSQFQDLAQALVADQSDVILVQGTVATGVMQRQTRTIPIVFVNVSDPIGAGFVASLASPGANLTGALQFEAGIPGKWLAMLKEIAPNLARVALVGNPKTSPFDYFLHAAEDAAQQLHIELVPAGIENTAADIERVIGANAAIANSGLAFLPDGSAIDYRDLVIGLAAKFRAPAVYPFRAFVEAGGLMCYGIDQPQLYRLAATYVDRILRGAKPASMPVQAPTKYETVVNLKAAKAIGITVPASLLVRADEVIE
jgi:putative tryptophan/tyrosine transport system substrate-binding protein